MKDDVVAPNQESNTKYCYNHSTDELVVVGVVASPPDGEILGCVVGCSYNVVEIVFCEYVATIDQPYV